MRKNKRITGWVQLGNFMNEIEKEELDDLCRLSEQRNAWFTQRNIRYAWFAIASWLNERTLTDWLTKVPEENARPKKIGLVLAGNLPMVGFHDILTVLATGHKAVIKLSSDDDFLIPYLLKKLTEFEPGFKDFIIYVDKLKDKEAVIATGSNNTLRYFEYYFKDVPNILRGSKTSLAIIRGDENEEELRGLADDMLLHFGKGCRSVSKLLVPEKYDIKELFPYLNHFQEIFNHSKYLNNYEYNKSIYLINRIPFEDNGFTLFKEDKQLYSPVSVTYFERYKDQVDLNKYIEKYREDIQAIVDKEAGITPGKGQKPKVDDYADGVNTLEFLVGLK